jgi:hypothetical protein
MAISTPLPIYRAPRPRPSTGTQLDPDVDRVRKLAKVLDHKFLDPLLGFVLPGVGDLIGSILGLYVVAVAVRRKMSPVIIARMLMNLAIDAAAGVVPVIGDAADLVFKANERNVALLTDRAGSGGRATTRDWLMVGGAVLAFVGVIALAIYAITAMVRWIA